MADPLSITGSIAGVVTLAHEAFRLLTKYYKSAKDAPKEIKALVEEISLLGGALNSLTRLAWSFDDGLFDNSFRMHHIEGCREILSTIDKKLNNLDGSNLKQRAIWPFSSSRVKEMLAELSRHKDSIGLALEANSMELLLRSLARTEDLDKITSEISKDTKKSREIISRIHQDSEREKVLGFFLRYNPQQNYDMSRKLRHHGTGLWLTHLPKFRTWLTKPREKLWLCGIPGAGKTVLAGTIIEEMLAQCNDSIAGAFFFCDYKNEKTQLPVNVLGALAYQIAIQKESAYTILERYYHDLRPMNRLPRDLTVTGLEKVLIDMIKLFDQVFIVVDGIDECGKHVDDVLEALSSISDRLDNLSMAFLSRDEPNIRDSLEEEFVCEEIAAHTEDVTEYVTSEIEERMRTKRLRIKDLKLKGDILQGLVDGANGMFRWVACQLDHLGECDTDRERRKALAELPPDLNETYIRILERIPKRRATLAQQALQCIAYAIPRLNIMQLREILSVPEAGGTLEPEDLIYEDSIRRLCSSFIRKSNDGQYFEFAHFSVLEFLKNSSLLRHNLEPFLISKSRCNRLLARKCLKYLQLETFGRAPVQTRNKTEDEIIDMNQREVDHPLYRPAAMCWHRYAKDEWADQEIILSAQRLFSPEKTAQFVSWSAEFFFCLYYSTKSLLLNDDYDKDHCDDVNDDRVIESTSIRRKRQLELLDICKSITPLHLAAMLSLPVICSHLLKQGVDVEQKSLFGTPLQCAIGTLRLFEPKHSYILSTITNFHAYLKYHDLTDAYRFPIEVETVKCLLGAGAKAIRGTGKPSPNPQSYLGKSLFHTAILVAQKTRALHWFTFTFLVSEGLSLDEWDVKAFAHMVNEPFLVLSDSTDFERFVKSLSSLIDKSPHHREICSLAWESALEHGAPFARDPGIVDPRISVAPAAQKACITAAVDHGDIDQLEKSLQRFPFDAHDITDSDGRPLLRIALESRHCARLAVINSLLNAGCSLLQPDGEEYRPVHRWGRSSHNYRYTMKQIEQHIDFFRKDDSDEDDESLVKLFIAHGVTVDSQDPHGCNLLHLHVGEYRRLLHFLEYDTRENVVSALSTTNRNGYTPLCEALRTGHADSASLLLERGGSNPQIWQSPIPALCLAIKSNCEHGFRYLWSAGERKIVNKGEVLTPLHCIGSNISISFVNYLKSLYQDCCTLRMNGRLPLETYLEEVICNENSSIDVNVIEALAIPVAFKSNYQEGRSVWEHLTAIPMNAISQDRNKTINEKAFSEAITHLIRLGCLKSYETASRRSGILPLLENQRQHIEFSDATYEIIRHSNELSQSKNSLPIILLLKEAIISQHVEGVTLLLQKGVPIHQREEGISALEMACHQYMSHDIFRLLLNHANLERLNETNPRDGLGLIHYLQVPDARYIIELLQRGADPNLRTSSPDRTRAPPLVYHLKHHRTEVAISLLENGADPTVADAANIDAALAATSSGATAFLNVLHAVKTQSWSIDWQRTSRWISHVKGRSVAESGLTALHLASLAGSVDCLKFYLNHQLLANLNLASDHMHTPVHAAALGGHVDVVKFLHKHGANINARTDIGQLPLHHAVFSQQLEVVKFLLLAGSDNTTDNNGMSPYLYACQLQSHDIVEYLRTREQTQAIEHISRHQGDIRISLSYEKGFAKALENAVTYGNISLCEQLVQRGCSLNSELPGCNGCSALLLAIREGKLKMIRWLLANGASTLKQGCSKHGSHSAINTIIRKKGSPNIIREFLDRYLNDGGSLLHEPENPVRIAVSFGDVEGLRILLEHLQQNKRRYGGQISGDWTQVVSSAVNRSSVQLRGNPTPLHLAASQCNIASVELLLDNNAAINALTSDLRTPLHKVVQKNSTSAREVLQMLIKRGADLECRDRFGDTPLIMASRAGNWKLVEVLLNAKADPNTSNDAYVNALQASARAAPSNTISGHREVFVNLHNLGLDAHSEVSGGLQAMHSAMYCSQFAAIILNGDYEIEKTKPVPWNAYSFGYISFLTTKFRLYRRRLPIHVFRTIINSEPDNSWSPLCGLASVGRLTAMENLLATGAILEFEGCPAGTALMIACEAGKLESVKLLLRRGAALSYHGPKGFRTAFDETKTPKRILDWLLVTRFTDQAKLEETSDNNPSIQPVQMQPWSGTTKAELVICGSLERRSMESAKEYWIRLMRAKTEWRGKFVPPMGGRRTARPSRLIPFEPVRIHTEGYEVPRVGQGAAEG
ncbi:ankyrin [Whalleya microplaca]|nr:ankyrin [Whalleya microplaca]